MGNTLAIHWSATTHGTWLHGDPRGSWRDGRLIGPDPYLEAESRARMSRDAIVLSDSEKSLIAAAFGEVVLKQRHRIFAATIQATHVHLVLSPVREDIDTVIARFKRRSAGRVIAQRRRLAETLSDDSTAGTAGPYSRAILARRHPVPRSLWTAGKFPVFIFDERHLTNAIEYVRDHNRRIGLPADPFNWIQALYPAAQFQGQRIQHDRGFTSLPF